MSAKTPVPACSCCVTQTPIPHCSDCNRRKLQIAGVWRCVNQECPLCMKCQGCRLPVSCEYHPVCFTSTCREYMACSGCHVKITNFDTSGQLVCLNDQCPIGAPAATPDVVIWMIHALREKRYPYINNPTAADGWPADRKIALDEFLQTIDEYSGYINENSLQKLSYIHGMTFSAVTKCKRAKVPGF